MYKGQHSYKCIRTTKCSFYSEPYLCLRRRFFYFNTNLLHSLLPLLRLRLSLGSPVFLISASSHFKILFADLTNSILFACLNRLNYFLRVFYYVVVLILFLTAKFFHFWYSVDWFQIINFWLKKYIRLKKSIGKYRLHKICV